MTEYPHQSEPGTVTVIGPECFASPDESVVCWKGVNYYREPDDDELARVFVAMDGEAPTEIHGKVGRVESIGRVRDMAERANRHGYDLDPDDVLAALDGPPPCTTCGLPMDDPSWCSRNPATGKGGHTHGGGVAQA